MARVLDRNNIEFIRRGVRLFLLLHGGLQVVKSNTKCSGHILDFNVFFGFSLPSLHSHAWGWSLCLGGWADRRCHPRPREERPRGLNPRLNSLSGHNPYILALGKITEDLLRWLGSTDWRSLRQDITLLMRFGECLALFIRARFQWLYKGVGHTGSTFESGGVSGTYAG